MSVPVSGTSRRRAMPAGAPAPSPPWRGGPGQLRGGWGWSQALWLREENLPEAVAGVTGAFAGPREDPGAGSGVRRQDLGSTEEDRGIPASPRPLRGPQGQRCCVSDAFVCLWLFTSLPRTREMIEGSKPSAFHITFIKHHLTLSVLIKPCEVHAR